MKKFLKECSDNFRENWKEEGGIMGLIMPVIQNWVIMLTAMTYTRLIIEFFRATTYNLPLG
jgi:hypothetical protein